MGNNHTINKFLNLLIASLLMIFVIVLHNYKNILNQRDELLEKYLQLVQHDSKKIVLTAYNSYKWQTDDTPHITASGAKTSYQTLALSRDLIKAYNEHGIANYGDTVRIVLIKDFIVEDTMNKRYMNYGDIWTHVYEDAIKFGKQGAYIVFKRKD